MQSASTNRLSERIRKALTTDKVSEYLEGVFGAGISPVVLYQGEPYVCPEEVKGRFPETEVIQRDIRIDVPCGETDEVMAVLYARSWIALNEFDDAFGELLRAGRMTIGQILCAQRLVVEYQNMEFGDASSEELSGAFGAVGAERFYRRSRMILLDKRPVIFIREYVPACAGRRKGLRTSSCKTGRR